MTGERGRDLYDVPTSFPERPVVSAPRPLVVSSREALAEHLARELIYTGGDPCGLLAPSFRAHMFNNALEAVDKALASGVVVEAATLVSLWPCYRTGKVRHDTCLTRNAAAHESALCERCAALADGEGAS